MRRVLALLSEQAPAKLHRNQQETTANRTAWLLVAELAYAWEIQPKHALAFSGLIDQCLL